MRGANHRDGHSACWRKVFPTAGGGLGRGEFLIGNRFAEAREGCGSCWRMMREVSVSAAVDLKFEKTHANEVQI